MLLFVQQIVDPTATKPEDWDEDAPAHIIDPNAVKPDGWLDNEPEMIHGLFLLLYDTEDKRADGSPDRSGYRRPLTLGTQASKVS